MDLTRFQSHVCMNMCTVLKRMSVISSCYITPYFYYTDNIDEVKGWNSTEFKIPSSLSSYERQGCFSSGKNVAELNSLSIQCPFIFPTPLILLYVYLRLLPPLREIYSVFPTFAHIHTPQYIKQITNKNLVYIIGNYI